MVNGCCSGSKVQWLQVVFDGSNPGLSGLANPPSPVSRRSQNGSLDRPVMIRPGVSTAEITKKET